MPKNSKNLKIKYMLFLSNASDSLTKIKLNHNLVIKSLGEEAVKFLSELEGLAPRTTYIELVTNALINLDTNKVYFIEAEIVYKEDFLKSINKYQNMEFRDYLNLLLTALRLFKRGDIGYWNHYFFYPTEKTKRVKVTGGSIHKVSGREIYSLLPSEIKECSEFINTFKLPREGYLKLAIEHFNNSYVLPTKESEFLSLMISLEALFSPQAQEASFRIARNCAIFLSEDYDEGTKIYSDLKEIQIKRNKLIHGKGKKGLIGDEDVNLLEEYVRRSIRKYLEIKESHDKLLNRLDTLGFGQFKS